MNVYILSLFSFAFIHSSVPTKAGPRPPLWLKNLLLETTTSVFRMIVCPTPLMLSGSLLDIDYDLWEAGGGATDIETYGEWWTSCILFVGVFGTWVCDLPLFNFTLSEMLFWMTEYTLAWWEGDSPPKSLIELRVRLLLFLFCGDWPNEFLNSLYGDLLLLRIWFLSFSC